MHACMQYNVFCTDIDGAFFGPTFPHLFLMTYEVLVPEVSREVYVPRVFGFKIHKGNYRTNSHSSGTIEIHALSVMLHTS
jgi:hypothetical protein